MRSGDQITYSGLATTYFIPMYNRVNNLTYQNFQNLSTGQFIYIWSTTYTYSVNATSVLVAFSAASELLNCYSDQFFVSTAYYGTANTTTEHFFQYFTKRIDKLKRK